MKKTICGLLVAVFMIICTGCREYTDIQTKIMYADNPDLFRQAYAVCEAHPNISLISDYNVSKNVELTKSEREVIKKCGKLGIRSLSSKDEHISNDLADTALIAYFYIQSSANYQNIIMFPNGFDTNNIYTYDKKVSMQEFLKDHTVSGHYVSAIDKLDSNVYYVYLMQSTNSSSTPVQISN